MNSIVEFMDLFDHYKCDGITGLFYTFDNVLEILERFDLPQEALTNKGESTNGLPIPVVTLGKGRETIMMWARMHGNEPTATKAVLDIINFFTNTQPEHEEIRSLLLEHYRFVMIPVLNPDGMKARSRYTYDGLDMNRDAAVVATKESALLVQLQKSYQPVLAFNLHDQNPYYAVGDTDNPTMIALLAPPVDDQDTYEGNRKEAAQLISEVIPKINRRINGYVARWSSDFEPRAFGEWMQMKGVRTILIESGFHIDDTMKEYQRQLNFALILKMSACFHHKDYLQNDMKAYLNTPLNKDRFFDMIIRDVQVGDSNIKVDLALNGNHDEMIPKMKEWIISTDTILEEWGDLSVFNGHMEINAHGACLEGVELSKLSRGMVVNYSHFLKRFLL